ncbi:hypothetical protein D3C81_09950 [compost metagenome]
MCLTKENIKCKYYIRLVVILLTFLSLSICIRGKPVHAYSNLPWYDSSSFFGVAGYYEMMKSGSDCNNDGTMYNGIDYGRSGYMAFKATNGSNENKVSSGPKARQIWLAEPIQKSSDIEIMFFAKGYKFAGNHVYGSDTAFLQYKNSSGNWVTFHSQKLGGYSPYWGTTNPDYTDNINVQFNRNEIYVDSIREFRIITNDYNNYAAIDEFVVRVFMRNPSVLSSGVYRSNGTSAYKSGGNYWVNTSDAYRLTVQSRAYAPNDQIDLNQMRVKNASTGTENTLESSMPQGYSSNTQGQSYNHDNVLITTSYSEKTTNGTTLSGTGNYFRSDFTTKFTANAKTYNIAYNSCIAAPYSGWGQSGFGYRDTIKTDGENPSGVFSPNSAGWGNSSIAVTFNPSDNASGVQKWWYRLSSNNGATWGGWSSEINGDTSKSITLSGEGSWKIQAEVWDNADNGKNSYITSGTYLIDTTAPSGEFSPYSKTWVNSNISVSFNPSDSGGSGVKRWHYRTSADNGSTWSSWSSDITGDTTSNITISTQGQSKIQASVYDNAGNNSVITSGTYQIDKTLPSGTFSPSSKTWGIDNTSTSFNPSDTGGSGVSRWRYRLSPNGGSTSWGSWSSYITGDTTSTININGKGHWIIQAEIIDNAGNSNVVASGMYYITTKPIAQFTVNSPVLVGQSLTYNDTSYTTESGATIAIRNWRWSTDNSTWFTGKPTSFSLNEYALMNESGLYYIQEQVIDSNGITSDWSASRQVTVYRINTKPTVSFTIAPNPQFITGNLTYTINKNANDTWDSIIAEEWSYSVDNGVTWSSATSTPTNVFNIVGNYKIRYRVKDTGNILSGALWSDYYIQDLVITKPIADFTVSPNPYYTYLSLNYVDNSRTTIGGNNVNRREWSYSSDNGVTWSNPTSTPTTIFTNRGSYKIRLRVASTKVDNYPEVWSDYCVRDIRILNNLYLTPTIDINPAKQGQKVTLTIDTKGYAIQETIKFPVELGGNTKVLSVMPELFHTEYLEHIVPMTTPVTIDSNGNRVRQPYIIEVTALNNDGLSKTELVQLDIQGNVLDNIFTEIK